MKGTLLTSTVVHTALLSVLFVVRPTRSIIVPGPDVVQVALLGELAPPPPAPVIKANDAVAPDTVGFRMDADLTGTASFALEIWSGVTGQACTVGGFPEYGYWLFPGVKDARWGEWVIQNGALTLTFTARAIFGGGWGVGPYDIRRDAVAPATLEPLLTAIGASQPMHFEVTSAPLPTPACGAVVLPAP